MKEKNVITSSFRCLRNSKKGVKSPAWLHERSLYFSTTNTQKAIKSLRKVKWCDLRYKKWPTEFYHNV